MIDVYIRDFARAVKIAAAVPEKNKSVPILGGMKVRANGRLEIEATDLDMTATVILPCENAVAGTVSEFMLADPAATLSAIGAAGGATASFEVVEATGKALAEQQGFTVRAGQLVRTERTGMLVEDFPPNVARIAQQDFSATLSTDVLRQVARVFSAVSAEETRYYLNGVHVRRLDGWTYRFQATDGHRLMLVDVPLPDAEGELPSELILPRKFMACLFNHLRNAEGPLTMTVGSGIASNREDSTAPERRGVPRVALAGKVGAADVCFATKVIDGTFPETSRVIPIDPPVSALFDVAELRRAILATAGGKRTFDSPALSIRFVPGGALLGQAFGIAGVSAEYRIACEHNAEGFAIGFRAYYVLDMLAAITSATVQFAFDGGASAAANPVTIRDVADPTFLGVLMPMRF